MIFDLTQEDHDDNDEREEDIESQTNCFDTSIDKEKKVSDEKKRNLKSERIQPIIQNQGMVQTDAKTSFAESDVDEEDNDLLFSSPVFRRKEKSSYSGDTCLSHNEQNEKASLKNLKSNKSQSSSEMNRATRKKSVPQKQRMKEIEKQQKQLQKAEREMQREIRLKKKKKMALQEKQANGKFCSQEIGLYLEKEFATSEDLGASLIDGLRESKYPFKVSEVTKTSNLAGNDPSAIEGCIQWVRRDHLLGGPEGALNEISEGKFDNIEWMEVVVILFHDCTKFLNLLEQEEHDVINDEYPKLQSWVHHTRSCLKNQSGRRGQKPRIILVLHQVLLQISLQWKNGGKRRNSFSPTNEEELHDAVTWLLMEEQIECEITSNEAETINFITSLTRALSELPYFEQPTELHCIKKFKLNSDVSDPLEKAKDCWKKQLQQIPYMSEAKATYLTSFYPTARSLMDKYLDADLSEHDKRELLAYCIQEGRCAKKLSESVYRLMTGTDETELL